MRRLVGIFLGALLLSTGWAHAQSVTNIPSAYVPEANYKRLKCDDLLQERARTENDLVSLFAQLQDYRSRYFVDLLALGLPLATMSGNTVAIETRLEHNISHLKGELEAITLASNRKSCSVDQRTAQP